MGDQALLTDIALRLVDSRALSIYRASRVEKRELVGGRGVRTRDLVRVSGRANLAQAVSIRLLTPVGELAPLGHPEYGSRLPNLIGERRTETTRNLAKLYVIEALKQERRIAEVVEVAVVDHPGERHRIDIAIRVRPIEDGAVLDLGPFTLDLG